MKPAYAKDAILSLVLRKQEGVLFNCTPGTTELGQLTNMETAICLPGPWMKRRLTALRIYYNQRDYAFIISLCLYNNHVK